MSNSVAAQTAKSSKGALRTKAKKPPPPVCLNSAPLTLTKVNGRMLRPMQQMPINHGSQPSMPVHGRISGPIEKLTAITLV